MKSGSQQFINQKVKSFLESDENSRLCPGKRDQKKIDGVRYQTRYLNGTLKDLHKKFVTSSFKISFALFCRVRPRWIIKAKVNSRDNK